MKKKIILLFCLLTAFLFSESVVQGYSPPNLSYAGYTSSPFATSPNYLVGQCTWYAYGRIQEVGLKTSSQLASLPNRNGGTGIFLGNASTWVADAVAAGFSTGSTPQVGALAVWSGLDHVAFVESVSGSTTTVTESNNKPKPGANVVVGGAYARLRSTMDASSSGNILWTMPQFTVMNVLSGPSAVVNGYRWFQLTGNGYTGYVAWLDLVPSQPATDTSLQWNITQFKNSAASQWITSVSPTYIYLSSSPSPSINSVTPNPVTGSNIAQTLTINGSGFVSPAQVRLQASGVDATKAATYISDTQLQVSAIFGNDPSTWTAQVINSGGATSGTASFAVNAPMPAITSLSPSSASAGGAAFTLTVNGDTFDHGSVVRWNGANRTTTLILSSGGSLVIGLQASILAADIASAGTAQVTVYNPSPGGGTSAAATFTINSVGPTISSVSPNPVTGSNSAQNLTINGSGFVSGAQVRLQASGVDATKAATFISSIQLQVSATFGNDPSSWTAQVINPGPVTSSAYGFTVQAPVPVIQSLSPSNATAGGSGFTLTVNGSTFDQSSVVRWNGVNLTTTPNVTSGGLTTYLTAQVPASNIASSGTATVTVYNPSPGGGTSAGVNFPINSIAAQPLGVDVYEGSAPVDWSQVYNAGGKRFAFLKASSGIHGVDTEFPNYMSDIKIDAPNLLVGAYHFAYPMYTAQNTGAAEAQHLLTVAGNYVGAGYLPPVLDIEDDTVALDWIISNHLTPTQLVQWVIAWAQVIQQTKNVTPIIYTTKCYIDYMNQDPNPQDLQTLHSFPVWIATYYNPDPTSVPPWTGACAGSITSWTFQQYATDPTTQGTPDNEGGVCPGIYGTGGYADLDSFNGDMTALNNLAGNGTQPPSDMTPPTISTFNVSPPSSVTLGLGFTVSYTVSDSGGSHLKQVELWRASVDGTINDTWTQIGSTIPLSGDGPSSGSFPTDIPLTAGNYWYGIHVIDNANNYMDERIAGLGPLQRTVTAPSDTTPPMPNPSTWATAPYATGTTSISMTATTASDPSGVQYFFHCLTTGGHDSVWQASATYQDTGLSAFTTYTYQVKTRDNSTNQNQGSYSTSASATTQAVSMFPTFSISDPSPITEGDSGSKILTFLVTMSGPSTEWAEFSFSTADGTATAGSDYGETHGNASFAPGYVGSLQIQVSIYGDTAVEGDESFYVNLSNVSGATLAKGQGLGIILNDDSATTPPLSPMTVDLNHDGIPNFRDFSVFAPFWHNTSCSPPNWCNGSDFDKNGIVDIHDLQIFAEFWLWPAADVDTDGAVDFVDYTIFANHWKEQNCAEPDWCEGTDFDHSGSIDIFDLAKFTEYWLSGIE